MQENEDDYGTCSGSVQYMPVYTLHGERGANLARHKLSQVRGFTNLLSPTVWYYVNFSDSFRKDFGPIEFLFLSYGKKFCDDDGQYE